ncbi:MAG TPA: nucleotide sugar dehydrogenase [Usitatibacter sp.]|nr:nucleotide sugar dehydrogenase [Usitatibacter sp.]
MNLIDDARTLARPVPTRVASAPPGPTVGVVGLGYVGLPLAVGFGHRFRTVGFDIAEAKVAAYRTGVDPTGEVPPEQFSAARWLEVTTREQELREAEFIVIAVPTPVDEACMPDFGPLVSACEVTGRNLRRGATVVFESTVYPGATEEVCVPVLERHSGLRWKRDFFVGYSPERINPGDKEHTLARIVKVVAGDTPETLERVAALYSAVVEAGVYRASSIAVAEAAKVIENTQRDLNIALVNELAIIFHQMGIDTLEVLKAAGTKWNFLPFRPGLVGGHCIGVDPYYLTYKAQTLGYHPQVILSGRRINDSMGKYVAEQAVKRMLLRGLTVLKQPVIVLGLTFKENCADIRNTRVVDVVAELKSFGAEVLVHDPQADAAEARHEYGIELVDWENLPRAAAVILAVAHDEIVGRPLEDFVSKLIPGGVLVDVKSRLDAAALAAQGVEVWRL